MKIKYALSDDADVNRVAPRLGVFASLFTVLTLRLKNAIIAPPLPPIQFFVCIPVVVGAVTMFKFPKLHLLCFQQVHLLQVFFRLLPVFSEQLGFALEGHHLFADERIFFKLPGVV